MFFVTFAYGEGINEDEVWVSDWREIAGPKDPTTSDCVGKMTSPLCVADTMVACDT